VSIPIVVGMATPLDRLSLDDLRRRTSLKWRRYPVDVLPLWVAEMDVTLAEPVVETLIQAVRRGDTGYPVPDTYAGAMQEFARKRWGWTIEPDRTRIVPDVMQGIVEVLRLITAPGDPVVVNSPVYTPFYQFVGSAGRRVVEAPLSEDYRLDLDRLDQTFRDVRTPAGSAAYLLCNPHNPTGTVHTRDELLAVIALAADHGVRVVVDEIHAPLVYDGHVHVPFLTLPGSGDAYVLVSASKAWNLAGLKAALAVAGPAAAAELARMPPEVANGPTHFGVIAHTAALLHGSDWLDDLLSGLDRNRRLLAELLADHVPAIGYRPPEGTYLAWLDCRRLGLGYEPARRFLEHGVALVEGSVFGTGGAGHVRLNIATSTEILAEAVERMATAVHPR
jgi:cysteine-S-conjugate beta-lyase